MMDFSFQTTPEILVRTGGVDKLGHVLADRFAPCRLLLVTDRGIAEAGLTAGPIASLVEAGFDVRSFDAVAADPPAPVVRAAVEAAVAHKAELIVGFGGGSSMDTAKLAAVLTGGDQALEDIYGIGNVTGRGPALVLIPTTAGTGSEVTPISVVTTEDDTKIGVVDPHLYADLAILDAELTTGMPRHVTAATGIDAMVHAVEAYTSRIRKNPMSDTLALRALSLLSANIVKACESGGDIAARENMLLGATLAGQAFANAPVAGVHAMAYPLGETFHLSHGLSNALVLPHVLRFNLEAATPLYAELADSVVPGRGGETARAMALIDRLEEIAEATGIERRLSQVGISHNHLPKLAADVMKHTRLLVNNPRELTEADALTIYQAAL